jgi:hypothetical protein
VSDQAAICPDCGMDLKAGAAAPPPAPPAPDAPAADFGTWPAAEAPAAPQEAPAAEAPAAPEPPGTPAAPAAPEAPAAPAPAPVAGSARLTVRRGGALSAETFVVGERAVVGRFDLESGPVDVDLAALPEANYVSRHHAEVWRDAGGQWFIKDLGSRNGTFVRAHGQSQFQRTTGEQPVADGDEIALGNARFEFRVE